MENDVFVEVVGRFGALDTPRVVAHQCPLVELSAFRTQKSTPASAIRAKVVDLERNGDKMKNWSFNFLFLLSLPNTFLG